MVSIFVYKIQSNKKVMNIKKNSLFTIELPLKCSMVILHFLNILIVKV